MSLGAGNSTAMPKGGEGAPENRQKILLAFFLVILTAAILFAASRLLPTAPTVLSESPTDVKKAERFVDTSQNPAAGTPITAGNLDGTGGLAPADTVRNSTEAVASALPQPVPLAADVKAAKTAPVVALIPASIKPKPPKPVRASRTGRYLLQFASLPSARDARREVTRLQGRLSRVLGNRKIAVVRAVPKGRSPVYRLRASAYQTRDAAISVCNRIKKLKVDCLVVRR
jgi:hypothetical protein